jgi:membrane-bound lytic murein transglycosylase A
VPYPTRGQIRRIDDFNTLAPPVAWLKDEVDLLVLQIQGSGKVQVDDGDVLHIQFETSNGQPYRSIGRRLIDQGRIAVQDMSMQAIRSYLQQHPDQLAEILDHNPRYIFFRKADGGPRGSLGVPLTPMRSLAVDHGLFPSAALAFFSTQFPHVNEKGIIEHWESYNSFALAQDAGSAIKGPGRADLFVGAGRISEVAAGHLKHPGQLHFLVLKP